MGALGCARTGTQRIVYYGRRLCSKRHTVAKSPSSVRSCLALASSSSGPALGIFLGGWLFRYVISVRLHAHFTPMLHEGASPSNGYEHALSIVGICSAGDSVSQRCGHGSHTMARRFPAGERCEPLQHGRKLILSLHLC